MIKSKDIFIKFLFITALLIVFAISALVKSQIYRINKQFPVDTGSFTTIIIGDSQARYAFDPDFISNSLNISQQSENIIYTFYVLNKILENNRGIRKIIVSVSYHSLGSPFAYYEPSEMLRRYHLLLPKGFYSEIAHHEGYYSPYLTRFFMDYCRLPLGLTNDFYEFFLCSSNDISRLTYIGKFEKLTGSRIDNKKLLRATLRRHYFYKGRIVEMSKLKAIYISKIIALCKSRMVELIFVTPPLHPAYRADIPQSSAHSFDAFMAQVQKTSGVKYINHSMMELPAGHFYEYDHLNSKGAEVFSKMVNREIEARSH
jgi:hypothetical protein